MDQKLLKQKTNTSVWISSYWLKLKEITLLQIIKCTSIKIDLSNILEKNWMLGIIFEFLLFAFSMQTTLL